MTCTWGGGTIKGFGGPLASSCWANETTRCFLGSYREVTNTVVRRDQSRQREEHLLGPNRSLQLLMASCGCVFASHLFCVPRFPAPWKKGRGRFKPLSRNSVCRPPSPLFCRNKRNCLQAAAQWLICEGPPQNQLLPGRFCRSTVTRRL